MMSFNEYEQIKAIANKSIDCNFTVIDDHSFKVFLPNGVYSVNISVTIIGLEQFETTIKYNNPIIINTSYFLKSGNFNFTISGQNFGEPYSISIKQLNKGKPLENCKLDLQISENGDINNTHDLITCNVTVTSGTQFDNLSGNLCLQIGNTKVYSIVNFMDYYRMHNDKAILAIIIVLPLSVVIAISIIIVLYLKKGN
ncbi:hypothetical protein DICPUDRAFT_74309 [Dictyostelium purpureum]|uniref:Uncharacterized protein n=1 Tax=Dictyostelium purpureum TaxID=5786 RepID=F0Z7C9_DICPU|nr:uncharacterized protein DICPUDRAFT_74309 [Dictyostelium purpureum]EGC40155.1 hypothetical protein DICPUDRAFT_74309 [Dictyostelium purpureum]|eukprot:XP_003283345.1 hypothetical protein DICPUDRAFT_74309 [Dictyostelium purpureum]